jgi:hypothetical protein
MIRRSLGELAAPGLGSVVAIPEREGPGREDLRIPAEAIHPFRSKPSHDTPALAAPFPVQARVDGAELARDVRPAGLRRLRPSRQQS